MATTEYPYLLYTYNTYPPFIEKPLPPDWIAGKGTLTGNPLYKNTRTRQVKNAHPRVYTTYDELNTLDNKQLIGLPLLLIKYDNADLDKTFILGKSDGTLSRNYRLQLMNRLVKLSKDSADIIKGPGSQTDKKNRLVKLEEIGRSEMRRLDNMSSDAHNLEIRQFNERLDNLGKGGTRKRRKHRKTINKRKTKSSYKKRKTHRMR